MAAIDLTTLGQVKNLLSVNDNSSDTVLADLITACSQRFYSDTGRQTTAFTATTYTLEKYNGPGGQVLQLEKFPVISVSAVVINGQTIPASPDGVAAGWVASQSAVQLIGYYFTRGFQNVQITYQAGYTSVPTDVEMAVREMVALLYKQKKAIGEVSQNIQGAVVTHDKIDVPKFSQSIINRYKVRFPSFR